MPLLFRGKNVGTADVLRSGDNDMFRAWMRQVFEATKWTRFEDMWSRVERELQDLNIKWSRWYTLVIDEKKIDGRFT